MTTTTALTDRDRLAAAFAELTSLGYLAPVEWGAEMCCSTCGFHAAEKAGKRDRVVFWHYQTDDTSFFDPAPIDPPRLDESLDEWRARLLSEPITPGHSTAERAVNANLRYRLALHWVGDEWEIVDVLCRHGLDAELPAHEGKCILVHPRGAR
jgi:hypothetical protein